MSGLKDWAPYLEQAFDFVPEEGSYPVEEVAGEIPPFLRGTYYVNGPARFFRGDLRYGNWLDGDGMVLALHFQDGEVRFTGRFVRSHKWLAEEEAGRPLYRTFGTAFEGDQLLRGVALASPVNVSVYPVGGILLAFGEQGLPWELDPVTLETRGEYTFGRLNPLTPFSAHPAFDPATGEMFNFGVSYAADRPLLYLFRFGPEGDLIYRRRIPLDHPYSLHDFSLSARYAVFHLAPYLLDVAPLLNDGMPVLDCLSWCPELGTRLLVVSRENGEPVASVPAGSRYCLHHANSFEEGDRLVVEILELEEPVYPDYQGLPDLFTEVAPAHPVRLVVDPGQGEVVERREVPFQLAADFPSIDPGLRGRPHRHLWMLAISQTGQPGRKFFDRLVHVDWEDWEVTDAYQAPPMRYLGGEPIFVAPPGESGAGVVICQEFDAERRRSSFLLFDAFQVGRGPIATLTLKSPVHLAFHASFAWR